MAAEPQWYVAHTYSGYENKVKANIEKAIQNRHLEDQIVEVSVPMQDVTEVKNGKKRTVSKKLFPGYVLVKMIMSDDSWYIIKNIRGVTGFVGSGGKPTALTEEEVLALGMEKREIIVPYAVGDSVKITDGPFTSFTGVVDAIDVDDNSVRVIVPLFGRDTPIELELDEVEPVSE